MTASRIYLLTNTRITLLQMYIGNTYEKQHHAYNH